MNLTLSIKELILLCIIALFTALITPVIMVPLLNALDPAFAPKVDNATDQSPQALVDVCKERIILATHAPEDALRIDYRSTGFRDQLFNVHGYVRQGSDEFDFQCWFKADFSFDTFSIGRVSLEEINRASALRNF